MVANPVITDYCPSCGRWDQTINEYTGWCGDCSPQERWKIPCNTCGELIPVAHGSTICNRCKGEAWLSRYTDDLEFLIVYKAYSFTLAKQTILKIIRPICKKCGKTIKGGTPGETLFCKANPRCHKAYRRYRKLVKQGMTVEQAIREVTQ